MTTPATVTTYSAAKQMLFAYPDFAGYTTSWDSSSKITEIYTHVTTKGFDQIKSPLDTLDL